MAPSAAATQESAPPGEEEGALDAAEKIKEEELQVRRVQDWWTSQPGGPVLSARSPVLSSLEAPLLADLIAAGGGYHNILSADRLDALHRQLGGGSDPALEPLRKALQARGGSKAQARAVGMLLFKEARALLEKCQHGDAGPPDTSATGAAPPAVPGGGGGCGGAEPGAPRKLDETWVPPRQFVRSEAYPEGALMAARREPDGRSEIVARLPADFEYVARGLVGDYLEVELGHGQGVAYVPRTIGGQVLLVPGQPPVMLDEAWHPAQLWGRAEGYPEGAQMAAKEAPSSKSKQLALLPAGFEYMATGRVGGWLQVALVIDGVAVVAYVLHTHGDLVLLRPLAPKQEEKQEEGRPAEQPLPRPAQQEAHEGQRASEALAAARAAAEAASSAAAAARAASDVRVESLEAKVAFQARQIQALQAELGQIRSQLAAAAAVFAPATAAAAAAAAKGGAAAAATG